MSKITLGLLATAASVAAISAHTGDLSTCSYNGIDLWGDVEVVDSFPDITVRVVDNFPDLNVEFVDGFADSCGQWEIVDSFPDFTIQFVDSFPDIEIEIVDNYPGLP